MNNKYKDFKERSEYNKNIHVIPQRIKDLEYLRGQNVVVKLFKYEEHATTETGLINDQYKTYTTESGRVRSEISPDVYKALGVVVKIAPTAHKLTKENWERPIELGDVVWLHRSVINPSFEFIPDPDHAVAGDEGFIECSYGNIIGREGNIKLA
jgi:hypothetical protein